MPDAGVPGEGAPAGSGIGLTGVMVQIKWVANPFRGDKFEAAWRPAAEKVLDYGATWWTFLRAASLPGPCARMKPRNVTVTCASVTASTASTGCDSGA